MLLKKGSKGTDVVLLQKTLNEKGYNVGTADGIFGSTTEQKVKDFQKDNKITVDGVVGNGTWSLLVKGKSITITAGHSNVDPGAVNGKYTEANLVTELRNIVSAILKHKGYTVFTDGVGEDNKSLNEAVKLIDKSKISIELHLNASSNKEAKGIEALSQPKDKKLCQDLCRLTSKVLKTTIRGSDGGWKSETSGQHTRLAYVSHGGIIFEGFFISNETELKTYLDNKDAFAMAIVEAIELNI